MNKKVLIAGALGLLVFGAGAVTLMSSGGDDSPARAATTEDAGARGTNDETHVFLPEVGHFGADDANSGGTLARLPGANEDESTGDKESSAATQDQGGTTPPAGQDKPADNTPDGNDQPGNNGDEPDADTEVDEPANPAAGGGEEDEEGEAPSEEGDEQGDGGIIIPDFGKDDCAPTPGKNVPVLKRGEQAPDCANDSKPIVPHFPKRCANPEDCEADTEEAEPFIPIHLDLVCLLGNCEPSGEPEEPIKIHLPTCMADPDGCGKQSDSTPTIKPGLIFMGLQ